MPYSLIDDDVSSVAPVRRPKTSYRRVSGLVSGHSGHVPVLPEKRFLINLRTVWAMLTIAGLSTQVHAVDGLQDLEPYKVWLQGQEVHRSILASEVTNLSWVIKEYGLRKYNTVATNDSYTYHNNRTGVEFVVYLESFQSNRCRRVSNTLAYGVGAPYGAPIISSAGEEVAVVNRPYQYQITTSGNPTRFSAKVLPDGMLPVGLSVDSNGLIKGTPQYTGDYVISLYAENGRDMATSTLRLHVVSGNNGGGLLDSHTIVINENRVLTRTSGDGPSGGTLYWIAKLDGSMVQSAEALRDTRFLCDYNHMIGTFTIYLATDVGQRVSNIVTYHTSIPVSLQITSGVFHPGTAGNEITPYTITANEPFGMFSAKGLPSGLFVSGDRKIKGVPTEYGTFPVTVSILGSGFASKKVSFMIDRGPEDYTARYTLAMDPDHVVTRTAGAHTGLVWVVRSNGNREVVRRSALGELSFSYSPGEAPEDVHIYLEAWIKGKYRPVSNVVAFRTGGTPEQRPVFLMDDSYMAYQGAAIEPVPVHVAGSPYSITMQNLPQGLYYDSATNAIMGVATNSGIFHPQVTAANSYGTSVLDMTFEIRTDTRVAVEDRFHLAVLPGYHILRTSGKGDALRWVVCRNGQRVYEYADAGRTQFSYGRHSVTGEFTVFLEDFTGGRFTRVSNIVGYRVPDGPQGPVLSSDRTYVLQSGISAELQLQASGSSNRFAAEGLPAGLALNDTNGLIAGAPLAPAVAEALVTVIGPDGVSTSPVVFHVESPHSMDPYLGLYLIKLDPLNGLIRSPGRHTNLTWIISRDGETVLRRSADSELSYTYDRNYVTGAYTCCLQAYVDGAYRQVSNLVGYNVEDSSDFSGRGFRNLVEHAMGTRTGSEPHQLFPSLVNSRSTNESNYLTYRYPVNTAAADVSLIVNSSETLGSWTRATPISVSTVSGDEKGEVRDAVFRMDSNTGFFRLSAEPVR